MRSDVLVYISGPITPTLTRAMNEHVEDAAKVFFDLIHRGVPAFCPHLSAAVPGSLDIHYETWMAYDFEMLRRCTHVLMVGDWAMSRGSLRELSFAHDHAIPVFDSVAGLLTVIGQ